MYKVRIQAVSEGTTDAPGLLWVASPCPECSVTFTPSKDQLKDSVCESVCSLKRERAGERGSLVCRPQIYSAVTLTEESTFSSAARNRQRKPFWRRPLIHPVLSLCASDLPLLFQPSGSPSSALICTFKALFFPFMSQSSSSSETSQTLKNWTKQKAVTSVCLLLWSPTVHIFVIPVRATEKLESVPACTGQGLFETFNLMEKTDKPKYWFDLLLTLILNEWN